MKRFRSAIIILALSIYFLSASAATAGSAFVLDSKAADQGIFTLNYSLDKQQKVKVMVEKDGTSFYYNLNGSTGAETFPLQLGDGTYTIAVLENITGNQYRMLSKEKLTSAQQNPLNVYLQSIQLIKWNNRDEIINKAEELTKNLDGDEAKVQAIYEYIVQNYQYDFDKLDGLAADYLPDINEMEKSKKGICYDFSALVASMLRSVDIPTKMVKGYGDNIKGYHAWNEVYLNGKWLVIDTSADAQMQANKQSYSIYKDSSAYQKVSEF